MYAVYGASVVLGKPIEFHKLLDTKYIGSRSGSSAVEIVRAATDCGLHVLALCRDSGIEHLNSTSNPMILHVAAGEQLEFYNHWLLFVGCRGDRALVVDSLDGRRVIPVSDVLARWDGNAIYVGDMSSSMLAFGGT